MNIESYQSYELVIMKSPRLSGKDRYKCSRRAGRSLILIIPLAVWYLLTMVLYCYVPCGTRGSLVFLSSTSSYINLTSNWAHGDLDDTRKRWW